MSQEVDELFGKGGGAPAPRVALALGLMLSGLGLALCGVPCSTVPGGAVALLGWFVVEQDADRLEAGFLPVDSGRTVRSMRTVGVFVVLAIIGIVGLQFYGLTWSSAYYLFWDFLLGLASSWMPAPPPPPAP